jgi:hypothetical protein
MCPQGISATGCRRIRILQHDQFLARLAREMLESYGLHRVGACPTRCVAKSQSSVETPAASHSLPFPPQHLPSPASFASPQFRARAPAPPGAQLFYKGMFRMSRRVFWIHELCESHWVLDSRLHGNDRQRVFFGDLFLTTIRSPLTLLLFFSPSLRFPVTAF